MSENVLCFYQLMDVNSWLQGSDKQMEKEKEREREREVRIGQATR